MKKGIVRVIVGLILIILQVMSVVGNALAGTGRSIQISFDTLALFVSDLIFLISYFFVGIVGAILIISGLIARSKGEQNDQPPKEEVAIKKNVEEDPALFYIPQIPLSISLPILFAISVVILILIFILERS